MLAMVATMRAMDKKVSRETSPSFATYGVIDLDHLKELARATANKYPYGANKENLYKMLLETAITETNAGLAPMDLTRTYGRSIAQFDRVGYEEALRVRSLKGDRDFQALIDKGYMSAEFQRTPEWAFYMMRMFYLGKNAVIPGSLSGRAEYWKKYYNSALGAGTAQKYINLVQTHLGKDWT